MTMTLVLTYSVEYCANIRGEERGIRRGVFGCGLVMLSFSVSVFPEATTEPEKTWRSQIFTLETAVMTLLTYCISKDIQLYFVSFTKHATIRCFSV